MDLSALIALGKSARDVNTSFAALSNDFHESCVRTVGWQHAAEPTAFPNAFTSCIDDGTAARQWQAANAIVLAYVEFLGTLARGNADPGDYGLANFSKTLGGIGVTKAFNDAQQKAAVGAATSLIADDYNIKRRERLSEIIPAADTDLGTLISTLQDVAKTNYVTQLTTEKAAIRLYFEPNIARARPGVETLYAFNYRAVERSEMHDVDEHQAAVDHYVSALGHIRDTHGKIKDAVLANGLGDVGGIVSAYEAEYKPEVDALQKAFR